MKHLRAINRKARRIDALASPAGKGVVAQATGGMSAQSGADLAARNGGGLSAQSGEDLAAQAGEDVIALQNPAQRPHVPMGCTLAFSPGWEVDSAGGTAGLCQPVERDIYDCYVTCFWPAQVPDHMNNYPDWASKCATATKDWRNLDLVFP